MYGIPNMKLDKSIVERRVRLMAEEGCGFVQTATWASTSIFVKLMAENEAVLLATGSTVARDLNKLPGRHLKGIHFAMEFLQDQTQRLLDARDRDGSMEASTTFTVQGKRVIVIGGGDTGPIAWRLRCVMARYKW